MMEKVVYKLCNAGGQKKLVAASDFEELQEKAKKKFGFPDAFIYMADGTEVEDDEGLQGISTETVLYVAAQQGFSIQDIPAAATGEDSDTTILFNSSSCASLSSQEGLLERLKKGEKVVVAEGYLFNFEKRCYLQAGPYVPTVVLEHPDLVKQLHEEFVRAGSDVVLAFTYYGNRQKMNLISRATDLETLNRTALRIARKCADETGTLMAGNICNTNAYNLAEPGNREILKGMFKEQIEWAVEEGADFIVAETFMVFDEAMIALEAIKEYGQDLPSVVTLAIMHNPKDGKEHTVDGVEVTEAMKRLEASGADVVGLNCARGPETTVSMMENIKKSGVKVHLAAVPVPYRTTEQAPMFMLLKDPKTGKRVFPLNLDCFMSTRDDIYEFGRRCDEIGVSYIGVCCGNDPHYIRTLCESIGRTPPASKYSPDMRFDTSYGDEAHVHKYRKDQERKMSLGTKLEGRKA